MPLALGLVETYGLVAAIEAADAMVKASNVKLIRSERINPAMITITVAGEVAAVTASVEAGSAAAARVGKVLSIHVIPNPDSQLLQLYPELGSDSEPVSATVEVTELDTVPLEPETESEAAPLLPESTEPVEETTPEIRENSAEPSVTESVTETVQAEEDAYAQVVIDEEEDLSDLDIEVPDPLEMQDDIVFETQEYHYVDEIPEFETEELPEDEGDTYPENDSWTESEAELPGYIESEQPESFENDSELHQTFKEVFAVEPESVLEEIVPDAPFVYEDLFAQAERLEKERRNPAKDTGNAPEPRSIEPDVTVPVPSEPEPLSETADPGESDTDTDTSADDGETKTAAEQAELQEHAAEETPEDLLAKPRDSMNVHQLRRLARSTKNFPIQGREISKANRQELLYYFTQLS